MMSLAGWSEDVVVRLAHNFEDVSGTVRENLAKRGAKPKMDMC